MKILTRDDTEHGVEYVTRTDAEREIEAWKANHDNQVELKRIIAARPDLAERAPMVERLVSERNAAVSAIRWIMDSVGDQTCECACPPDVAEDSLEPFGDPADHAEYCPIYLHDFCRRNLPENALAHSQKGRERGSDNTQD